MPRLNRYFFIALLPVLLLSLGQFSGAVNNHAVVLQIDGPISPGVSDYIHSALETALEQGAKLVIIRMDTPGGLDSSMRDIIQDILASPVPVVTYVAPSGARAASAGTYILYASHIAAMAPATTLGAATPVQIGGVPTPGPAEPAKPKQDPQQTQTNDDTLKRKIINDAVAYIKGLARMRGRNVEWAEQAVREAASLPAKQALKLNVIDLVATDMADLVKQLHGRKVVALGHDIEINTQGITLQSMEPDWRSRLLSIITDPNVAYILMLIGIYGLIFEFSSPGAIVPGVVGAISLLLALFAFQVLPVNYAGLGLILLGAVLMIGEAIVPSFGALGFGGVVAFVIGSIILMDTDVPGYGVSLPLIGAFALFSSAVFTVVLVMALKARRRPVVSGMEQLLGATAEVIDDFDTQGTVRVHSETWQARTRVPLRQGQKVQVSAINGLILDVEPQQGEHKEESS